MRSASRGDQHRQPSVRCAPWAPGRGCLEDETEPGSEYGGKGLHLDDLAAFEEEWGVDMNDSGSEGSYNDRFRTKRAVDAVLSPFFNTTVATSRARGGATRPTGGGRPTRRGPPESGDPRDRGTFDPDMDPATWAAARDAHARPPAALDAAAAVRAEATSGGCYAGGCYGAVLRGMLGVGAGRNKKHAHLAPMTPPVNIVRGAARAAAAEEAAAAATARGDSEMEEEEKETTTTATVKGEMVNIVAGAGRTAAAEEAETTARADSEVEEEEKETTTTTATVKAAPEETWDDVALTPKPPPPPKTVEELRATLEAADTAALDPSDGVPSAAPVVTAPAGPAEMAPGKTPAISVREEEARGPLADTAAAALAPPAEEERDLPAAAEKEAGVEPARPRSGSAGAEDGGGPMRAGSVWAWLAGLDWSGARRAAGALAGAAGGATLRGVSVAGTALGEAEMPWRSQVNPDNDSVSTAMYDASVARALRGSIRRHHRSTRGQKMHWPGVEVLHVGEGRAYKARPATEAHDDDVDKVIGPQPPRMNAVRG